MPTYDSPASGFTQLVIATRFVQVTPATTSSAASGYTQMEISASLSNLTPSGGGGGGGSGSGPSEPTEPGEGEVTDPSGATIPAGRARGRGPTTGGTGRGL